MHERYTDTQVQVLGAAALALTVMSAAAGVPQATAIDEASVRAAAFDLPGAAAALTAAAERGDAAAMVAAPYIRGLLQAREAFRLGGAAEALEPVRGAIQALDAIARGRTDRPKSPG